MTHVPPSRLGRAQFACFALAGIALIGAGEAGGAGEDSVAQVADQILEKMRAGDDAIVVFARRDEPDPWEVALELLARGERKAAATFARAAPRADVRSLPAYVAGSTASSKSLRASLDALTTARVRLAARDGAGVNKALDAIGASAEAALATRVAELRGEACGLARDLASAGSRFTESAEIAEKIGWLAQAARAWRQRGFAATSSRDNAGALEAWGRARELWSAGGHGRDVAQVLANIGVLHSMQGDHGAAVTSLSRALIELRAVTPPADVGSFAIQLRYELANAQLHTGALSEAELNLAESVSMADAAGLRPQRAKCAALWGRALTDCGRSGQAVDMLSDLLSGDQLAASDAALFRAQASGHLGQANLDLGRLVDAEKWYRAAATAFATLGRDRDADAALLGAADAAGKEGHCENSVAELTPLLKRFHARNDDAGEAYARLLLARTAILLADANGAAEHLAAVRALHFGAASPTERGLLCAFDIRLLRLQGKPREAGRKALEFFDLVQQATGNLAETSAIPRRRAWLDAGAEAGILAARETGDLELLLRLTELRRGRVLVEALVNRERLNAADVPHALRDVQVAADASAAAQLAAYQGALGGGDLTQIRSTWRTYEASRRAAEEAALRVREAAKRRAPIEVPAPVGCAAAAARLAADEALVLYDKAGGDDGRTSAWALVITANAAPRVVDLPPPAQIAALCHAARDGADATVAELRAAIAAPLALTRGIRRVYLSPDGALFEVALDGVFTGYETVLVPSASAWALLRDRAPAIGVGVLALGDPAYPEGGSRREVGATRSSPSSALHTRLPATAVEAAAVGDHLLLGEKATETNLRAALASGASGKGTRWRSIHLACHGDFDEADPLRSSLALCGDSRNDGILTAEEVYLLPVNADLVVLSACSAGRGQVVGGEGLVGLVGAFLAAGATRVLVHWDKVDDEATCALMTRFYAEWKRGGADAPAALAAAQASVRADARWHDPRFWAGWRLWGLP